MSDLDEYESRLNDVVNGFIGHLYTRDTQSKLMAAIIAEQCAFLTEYPGYVAPYPPAIHTESGSHLFVDAPIVTIVEKNEMERRQREADEILHQINEQITADIEEKRRRYISMMRRYRRLMRRHGDQIPPSTRRVWGTLSEVQQYAILKDIDYAARHRVGPA